MVRVMPVLDANGDKQISMQNVVNVISADDDKSAYVKCVELAKLKYPDHNVHIRVIVDLDDALAETLEG